MIQLYRAGHTAFKLDSRNPLNLRCVTKAQLERKAMEQDAVAVTVLAVSPCEFGYRDYIIVDGRPYFLNVLPKVTKEDRRRFQYDLTFESGIYELGRVFYTMTDLKGWDYTGKLYDFCNLVINEMNRNSLAIKDSGGKVLRYSGRRIGGYYYWYNVDQNDTESYFTTGLIPNIGDEVMPGEMISGEELPTVMQVGGAWTLDFETQNGKPIETDEKFLTYDNHTCLAVMNGLVSEWDDWEFAVDMRTSDLCTIDPTSDIQCGGTIVMRRKATGIFINGVNTNHLNMAFGKKGGLSKITPESPDGTNIPSRIYFYGGTQNLPYSYRNTRLCLPNKSKMDSYIDLDVAENIPCEVVKVFDDIYPACKPFALAVDGSLKLNDNTKFVVTVNMSQFFNLYAKWHDPYDSTPRNYGSYEEWRLMHGTGNATTDLQRYLQYYYQGDSPALAWNVSDDSNVVIDACIQRSLDYHQPTHGGGAISDDVEFESYEIEYTSAMPSPAAPTQAGQTTTGTRTAKITVHLVEKIEYSEGEVTTIPYTEVYNSETITYTFVAVASGPSADFPKSCYLTTDRVTITFQTGNLAGHSFDVVHFEALGEDNEYELTLACEGSESMFQGEPIMYFPNNDIMCHLGDKFIVEGCLMPASYVYGNFGSGEYAAETMLAAAANDYIEEFSSKIKVGVEISQDFINQHNAVFRLYDGMEITDDDLGIPKLTFKMRRVVYDLLANSYKVEIDDGKGRNPWAAISQYIQQLTDKTK